MGRGTGLPGGNPPGAQVEQGADEEDHIPHQEGEVEVQVLRREGQEVSASEGGGEGGKQAAPHGDGHQVPQQPGKAPGLPPHQPHQAACHPCQGEQGVGPVQHPPGQGEAGVVVQGEQPHPHGSHPHQGQEVEDGDHRHPPAALQVPLVAPGGLEHVQQRHPPDGPDVKQPRHQEAHREKGQGKAHRVRIEGEGQLEGLAVAGQQQGGNELGEDHPQEDPQPQGQQADAEGLGEEEPGHGAALHPQHPLDGQGGLLLPEHVPVDVADEEPQQQRHSAHGHLHPVAEEGEVKLRPDVRVVVAAGDG